MNVHWTIQEIRLRHPHIYAGLSKTEKQKLVEIVADQEPTPKVIDKAYRQVRMSSQMEQQLLESQLADRETALLDYFNDYANPNSDPQDLQKRSHDLGITAREWQGYTDRQKAKAAGAF